MTILKQLWKKEVEEPEVKNSYQYVFELRQKLEETLKLAHSQLQKAQDKGSTIMIARPESENFSLVRKFLCYYQLITVSC